MDSGKFGRTIRDEDQTQALMDELNAQHAELKARVQQLESRRSLSTTEQIEVARLKKLKLRTKDKLYTLQRP